MKRLLLGVLVLVVVPVLSASALAPSHVDAAKGAKPSAKALTTQVVGKFTGSSGSLKGPGTFKGTFTVHHFTAAGHRIMAQGRLTGTLTVASGKTERVDHDVQLPFTSATTGGAAQTLGARDTFGASQSPMAQASCQILHLHTGEITLNLLGLVVTLSPITLDITAVPGAGNLLGNLLCGIAGLLNGGLGNLNQILLGDIVLLLNQILTALGGL